MPDRSLNIALLGYRGNPYSGGQGIYLTYLSRALVALGHRVTVIGGPPYPQLDPQVELVELPSLDLFNHPNHATALRPRHLRSWADTVEWWSMLTGGFAEPYTFGRRLLHWWRTQSPDFDIVHDNQSLCYALLRLQRRGVPIAATIHHPITSDRDIALAHASNRSERLLIRRWHNFLRMQTKVARGLEHIVTVSECSKRDIANAFGLQAANLRVIYNGIDTQIFKPRPAIQREAQRLISTASADQPLKGGVHLINAFAQLRESHPEITLTLIGKLKSDGITAQLIDQHNLADAIDFHSDLSADEIVDLYARASIAVVPSEYEGFGLPAGEAMACGLPLVSTTGGALPEVVGDAGVLVPPGDPNALAHAIDSLLRDPIRREKLGREARAHIEARFDWLEVAAQMTNFYEEVIAR